MKVRAGHCTKCGELNWRIATAAKNNGRVHAGDQSLLWPAPWTVYAAVATKDGYAPGINFCNSCAPEPGDTPLEDFGPVCHIEPARSRYAAWFTPKWGEARRAWLKDAYSLEDAEINQIMDQWMKDRRG